MVGDKEAINNFLVSQLVTEPISIIIKGLKEDSYRDCDVTWLNLKLTKYTDLSLELIGKKIKVQKPISGPLNDFNKKRFVDYFTTLLEFFKSIK